MYFSSVFLHMLVLFITFIWSDQLKCVIQGSKVTHNQKESDDVKVKRSGRTLEEARKLVEQSFGNYVGSNVMVAAKEELERIEKERNYLSSEITDESIDRKCREELSEEDYSEISHLQKRLKVIFMVNSAHKYICCYISVYDALNVVEPCFCIVFLKKE
jgi:hypothetical protein